MNVGTHWATRTVTSNQFDVSIEAFEGLYSVHSTLDSTTTLVVKHFIALSHRIFHYFHWAVNFFRFILTTNHRILCANENSEHLKCLWWSTLSEHWKCPNVREFNIRHEINLYGREMWPFIFAVLMNHISHSCKYLLCFCCVCVLLLFGFLLCSTQLCGWNVIWLWFASQLFNEKAVSIHMQMLRIVVICHWLTLIRCDGTTFEIARPISIAKVAS